MPEHGEIVVVEVPATKRRRRWCEPCYEWTWEVGRLGSGQFRHSRRGSLGIERPCKSLGDGGVPDA